MLSSSQRVSFILILMWKVEKQFRIHSRSVFTLYHLVSLKNLIVQLQSVWLALWCDTCTWIRIRKEKHDEWQHKMQSVPCLAFFVSLFLYSVEFCFESSILKLFANSEFFTYGQGRMNVCCAVSTNGIGLPRFFAHCERAATSACCWWNSSEGCWRERERIWIAIDSVCVWWFDSSIICMCQKVTQFCHCNHICEAFLC